MSEAAISLKSVLGYPVHVGAPEAMLKRVLDAQSAGRHQHVVTLNPEMLMRGEADPEFKRILQSADLVLPDGAGMVWALKRQKVLAQRVPGIEFSESLLGQLNSRAGRLALIGATPEVNTKTIEALQARFPDIKLVYTHHGFFADDAAKEASAQACAEAYPDVVLVALGVPGQEVWIKSHKAKFTHPAVFVGVGGSFDVWSGSKRRAPAFFLKTNLEWLYRISSEPWRIQRVYKTLPMFVVKIVMQRPTSG